MRRNQKWLSSIGKIVITSVILSFLAYRLPLNEIPNHLANVHWSCLVAAWVLLVISILISVVRWRLLLRIQGLQVGFLRLLKIAFVGQFFNSFLFGSTGGDFVMITYIMRESPKHKACAAYTVLADRLIGIVTLLIWSLVTMPLLMPRLGSDTELARVVYITMLVIAAGLLTVIFLFSLFKVSCTREKINNYIFSKDQGSKLAMLITATAQYFDHYRATGGAFLVGLTVPPIIIAAGWLTAQAIGLHATYIDLLAILPIVLVVASLPISIGGLGPREGMIALLFPAFGVVSAGTITIAVTYSLLLYLLTVANSLVGALVYITSYKNTINAYGD